MFIHLLQGEKKGGVYIYTIVASPALAHSVESTAQIVCTRPKSQLCAGARRPAASCLCLRPAFSKPLGTQASQMDQSTG